MQAVHESCRDIRIHVGFDPCRGRFIFFSVPGVFARSSLDPRLLALMPAASGFCIVRRAHYYGINPQRWPTSRNSSRRTLSYFLTKRHLTRNQECFDQFPIAANDHAGEPLEPRTDGNFQFAVKPFGQQAELRSCTRSSKCRNSAGGRLRRRTLGISLRAVESCSDFFPQSQCFLIVSRIREFFTQNPELLA